MRVHQILARFEAGDAVSNMALDIHEALTARGIESNIFAHSLDDFGRARGMHEAAYASFAKSGEDILIYHYSVWCENLALFESSSNRRIVIYHNITPARFFEPYDAAIAEICRLGRDALPRLVGANLGLGVSEYNRRELVRVGFSETNSGVLPIHPPVERFDAVEPDGALERYLRDGRANLLYVGRLVPNKMIEDLIRLFLYYHRCVNARSRLLLAGGPLYPYFVRLQSMVEELGLAGRVVFLGKVSEPELVALYRVADVYLSMSEHEGFCVPLTEAWHFGVPVMAYTAAAVPETMGRAGVLFDEKDYPILGEMMDRILREPAVRDEIVAAQRERLNNFSRERFEERLFRHLGVFLT